MNTTPPDDWLALARRQHARAMAGDQRAASWCAKHAPLLDAARGWQAYNDLWDKFQRLHRAYDRLHLMWRGTDKLYTGRWKKGSPVSLAWSRELQESWSTPEAKADMDACMAGMDKWTPEHIADVEEAMAEFLEVLAKTHGLDVRRLQTQQQADRLVESFTADTFKETCHELAAELAGKEQANGTSDKHQLEAGKIREPARQTQATD